MVGKIDSNVSGLQLKSVKFHNSGVGEYLSEVDKGKKLWVRKPKLARLPLYYQKAVLIGKKSSKLVRNRAPHLVLTIE